MDKLEKCIKDRYMEEAQSLERESEGDIDDDLKPAEGVREKILRKITHKIESQ